MELPAEDRALSPAMEEVFRVGSFDAEMWETFGEVGGVAFDAAGNLHVFDPQSSRVAVADPSGAFLHEVGKPGEGPGELRAPGGFAVLRDGRVVVADMGHRAYLVYGPDGAFQRQVSMGGDGMIRLGDLLADPAGRGIVSGGGGVVVAMRGGPDGGPEIASTRPVDLLSLEGSEVETRTLVEGWRPPRDERPTTLEGGGMRFSMGIAGPRTFEPGLHTGMLPDGGVALVDSTTWAVEVRGPDGGLRRTVRRPFRPRPVTERMEEAERERQLRELEEGGGPRIRMVSQGPGGGARTVPQGAIQEMMKGRIAQMRFYPELPVVLEMRTGWDGTIWVQRRSEAPTEPGELDVVKFVPASGGASGHGIAPGAAGSSRPGGRPPPSPGRRAPHPSRSGR